MYDSKYKLFCGGWFAVWLPPSATNYSSTGRQKIPTRRHFCRPVTMLNEAVSISSCCVKCCNVSGCKRCEYWAVCISRCLS